MGSLRQLVTLAHYSNTKCIVVHERVCLLLVPTNWSTNPSVSPSSWLNVIQMCAKCAKVRFVSSWRLPRALGTSWEERKKSDWTDCEVSAVGRRNRHQDSVLRRLLPRHYHFFVGNGILPGGTVGISEHVSRRREGELLPSRLEGVSTRMFWASHRRGFWVKETPDWRSLLLARHRL